MFDKAEIVFKAGDGGRGTVAFHREKFIPRGGPDGGDGGEGGSVVIKADNSASNLGGFTTHKVYSATSGDKGSGQRKHGRSGQDLTLLVPPGTVITEQEAGGGRSFFADLESHGQSVVVAHGGRGGMGNTHFATSINQTPRLAQSGEAGEERAVLLELKLIADVGIIGYPNAGKSSLLKAASSAKPKIAAYPFTTLQPALGMVETEKDAFLLAEVPGLVEDAHLGRGLGHDFLRHISRTRVLIHLVDGNSPQPLEDMIKVNNELYLFDSELAQKPQLAVVNKVDIPQVKEQIEIIKEEFGTAGMTPLFISALEGDGVTELMAAARNLLANTTTTPVVVKEGSKKVFRPKPKEDKIEVSKEGGVFIVKASNLERIVTGSNTTDIEVRRQLIGQFRRYGVDRLLERAGATAGDRIRISGLETKW